ncbi:MAG TPA: roadblock/LC7 domain-containing protein [Vicinamibacteria bacterium]
MPYQSLLDGLMRAVPGGRGALLLDETGELVLAAGSRDESQHLMGAYQGIALTTLRKVAARYEMGGIEYVLCRYRHGHVILRPLREGYYLVFSLLPGADLARGLRQSALAQGQLNRVL